MSQFFGGWYGGCQTRSLAIGDQKQLGLTGIHLRQQQRKTCPLANNALGMVLKQLGDNTGALAAYKLAISQAGSDFPVVHYNYAILLEKTDNTREAVNEYKLYLKLAPQGVNVDQAQARLRRLGVDS